MYNLFQFPFDNRFPEKFCILKGNIPLIRILPQVFQNFPAYHQKFSRHKIYINLIYFYLPFCCTWFENFGKNKKKTYKKS